MKKILIFILLNILTLNLNAFEKKENTKKYARFYNTYPNEEFRGKIFRIMAESVDSFFIATDKDIRWVLKIYVYEMPEIIYKMTKKAAKRDRQKRNAKKHLVSKFFSKNQFDALANLSS